MHIIEDGGNGVRVEVRTIREGCELKEKLNIEILEIEAQLDIMNFGGWVSQSRRAWAVRARRALAEKQKRKRLLTQWMSAEQNRLRLIGVDGEAMGECSLLTEVYDVLSTVKTVVGVDNEVEEYICRVRSKIAAYLDENGDGK